MVSPSWTSRDAVREGKKGETRGEGGEALESQGVDLAIEPIGLAAPLRHVALVEAPLSVGQDHLHNKPAGALGVADGGSRDGNDFEQL